MVNNPSYQPHPHGATGKAHDAQPIRKRDVIRGILGFSKSKPKGVDATATNQVVGAQNTPQAVGPSTASSVSDIHSLADQPVTTKPHVDKPLPEPAAETKKTQNNFVKNLAAPVMKTELPAVQDRIEVTQQLVYCTALLLRGSSSPLATAAQFDNQACDPTMALQKTPNLDKKELEWLAEMDKNPPAKERIHWLGTRMVDEFAKDVLKDSTEIAEIVLLGPVLDNETYRSLLSCTISAFEQSVLLNVDLLQGLVHLVQVAPPESLVSDDLVKILRVIRICLQDTHQQSSLHPFHLTLALSRLLDVMAEHKVKDLNRVEDHEPLSGILSELKDSSDPYLMYQACYAFQALQYVPDDESALQSVLRHGAGVVNGLIQVSGVFKLDLGAVLEGLDKLQEALGGIIEVASDVYKGVNSVIGNGRGVVDGLKEGFYEGKKRPWYAAIRVAQALVQAGQLKDLNELIYEAPCRGDPLFQWGICQLLGEIASDVLWDTNVRQQAVDLLGELYKNDSQWGEDESVKAWMVNIICQLSTVPDQVVNAIAITLLKVVHQDQGTTTRLPYPLRNRLPLPTSSPILARVQDITPLEHDLYQYQVQRLQQHHQTVYIPPLAKPSLKAKDEDAFPLLEKVLEFLASERQVMLVLGDSGSGKSIFNRHLEHRLWTDYKQGGSIPLFINLPAIDRPDQDMIAKHLRANNFGDDQIQEMKQHRRFIIICDGYDESQQQDNLHRSNALNQPGQWNTKMVISCRTQFLGPNYVDRFKPLPTDRYASSSQDLFQEAVITPFSKEQIKNYVEQYARDPQTVVLSRDQSGWSSEEYMYTLATIPNIMDLVKNPFLLTLALKALPGLVALNKDLASIRVTRVCLYDMFVDQWLETNRLRIQPNKLSQKDLEAYKSLMDDDFIGCGIGYLLRLAAAIFKEQDGKPVVQYVHRQDKDSWKAEFFGTDPEAKLLREASPLTRTGNQFRFVHRSVLEYLLSRVIYAPVETVEEDMDPESEVPSPTGLSSNSNNPLFKKNLVAEPSIIQFLCDLVKTIPDFEQQLRAVIDLSKTDASAAIAAVNAITILVRAGSIFHGADLRGVKIAGADLSGGQFDHAQFQGADLRDVNLSRSWLRKADMSGAQMDGVQFGELPYLKLVGGVHNCAYSPDGRMLAVGTVSEKPGIDLGTRVRIYDTSTWTTCPFTFRHILVHSIAFSLYCTMVAIGSRDGLLTLWDYASGQEMFAMEGHSRSVTSVAFSPCGKHIASSSDDKTVRVWDSQTGESLFILEGHTGEVKSVKYSPSAEQLLSSGDDGTIRCWNSTTGEPGVVLNCSLGKVYSLAFSPDGRWMASGHVDGELQLWHAESGEQGPVLHGHTGHVTGIAFSPDSRWIASSSWDHTVRLWDASTSTLINTLSSHKTRVNSVVFSPNGLQIASGGDDGTVRLWDVDSILTSSVEQQDPIGAVRRTAYTPNGQYILTVDNNQTIKQWNSLTGSSRPLSIELPESISVKSVSYSLNGSPTVVATQDATIRLWELQEGGRETILEGSRAAERVIMSPCGRWVVSSDSDGTVTLWDLASTQQRHVLVEKGEPGYVSTRCVAFSATGHQLAVGGGGWRGAIWLFDTQSKGLITSKSTARDILVMSFSPDGQQLAVGASLGWIFLWDIQLEKRIELSAQSEGVECIAYSPCGEWIASGSGDKTVRLWRRRRPSGDTEAWACVSTVHGYFDEVLDIAWSPTVPMEFVTGCRDGSVRVWRVSSDGEDVVVKLLWGTNLAVLHANGLALKGTIGLGSTEKKLLVQRGAIRDSFLTLE
ncbi:WD40 repeat-like protein [Linnemannia elongata AG-77]|uniref:WD40 repeat-like protein n=1 Tax=Linnemannia elongata AG-77 TaxID=1314771 RepID=A0A197JSE5_9FUNG|nr:WD40 repeat-like protein [Linnemannia elongata AG-77]